MNPNAWSCVIFGAAPTRLVTLLASLFEVSHECGVVATLLLETLSDRLLHSHVVRWYVTTVPRGGSHLASAPF